MHTDLLNQLTLAAAPHGIEIQHDTLPDGRDRLRYTYIAAGGTYERSRVHLGHLTTEDLTDLITLFENMPINQENSMNIYSTDLFKYLAGDMLGQREIELTIASVSLERMSAPGGRGGEQAKPCLHFRERDKLMVLNKTNATAIAKVLGPETDLWAGGRITVSAPVIEAFGKSTRSLKIVKVEAADVPRAPRPRNGDAAQPSITYADGSPVADLARDAYRAYMAANDNQPPADVRALIAWQQAATAQDNLFGPEYDARQAELRAAGLATATDGFLSTPARRQ